MGDVVTALTTVTGEGGIGDNALVAANFWTILTGAIGLIAIGVLFGFGLRLLRKVTKKITKGTGGF